MIALINAMYLYGSVQQMTLAYTRTGCKRPSRKALCAFVIAQSGFVVSALEKPSKLNVAGSSPVARCYQHATYDDATDVKNPPNADSNAIRR